jgi:type IV pilus assembly protein PilA
MKLSWKKIFTQFFRKEAFSLVELMVVVAIIGILTSIAVPSYQKYQARARQVEAKVNLANIYTAENAFAVDQATYSTCLANIGYAPLNPSAIYYAVGFYGAGGAGSCGPGGNVACIGYSGYTGGTAVTCTYGVNVAFWTATLKVNYSATGFVTNSNLPSTSVVTNTINFIAGAVGNVSKNATFDAWTIDSSNTMSNVTSGI